MTQPSRGYTRLLNTLIDQRMAAAPRRSPWFHLNPGERADFLGEVDARLLEIQRTTLSVLAAQCLSLDDNPRDIDEHLAVLRQRRAQLDSDSPYRQALDRDISLYMRQQMAAHGFEGAWRKALRLLRAGNGLAVPCAGLLQRLQRMIDLLQRKLDAEGTPPRISPFARQQGWKAVAERYQTLLAAPSETSLAALERIPAESDGWPVNLSLLLMEERPGYVRMNVALVDPSYDGRYKDLHLEHGRLVTQTRGLMHFSFGTAARSLAWQQHYRLKHEPPGAHSPTFAPIRSVLVRNAFVEAFLGHYLVSEHSLRHGFLLRELEDGSRLRVLNVDRKVCNQIGIEAFDDPRLLWKVPSVDQPRRLEELLNRYADIDSFETIAVPGYAQIHHDPDRDGRFVSIRTLERDLGFGEHLYLLELPQGGEYPAVTPFAVLEVQGGRLNSRHLCVGDVQRAHAHNAAFFSRLEALREEGEGACLWLNSPREREAFLAQWLRLLERNHLTPGGVLPVPEVGRDSLRDVRGNPLGKVLWERAFADRVWQWRAVEPLLARLAGQLLHSGGLAKLLTDPYLQAIVAQARQLSGDPLAAMPHQVRARRLLKALLGDQQPDSEDARSLGKQALFHCLRFRAGQPASSNRLERPDPYLILNACPERLLAADNRWVIAEDKYRGYLQYVADPQHPQTRVMETLDVPFTGGISRVTEVLSREFTKLLEEPPTLVDYWRFQLANSAFWLRNGYHSLFETLYVAACQEPSGPEGIGTPLLALFERCRAADSAPGALYDGAMALILPLVNSDLALAERLEISRYTSAG